MAVTERRTRSRRGGSASETLIVGAGLAGSVMARQIAEAGGRVLVVDRRDHVAGNCFDHLDEHGVLVHAYGPHVFHTNAEKVWRWLSRFTDWRPYEQRVLASVRGEFYEFPINRTTLERFLGVSLPTSEAAERYLDEHLAEQVGDVRTSEDICLARFGRELYETFFKPYTRKQWGLDPSELDRSVCARIPIRTDRDDRYFTDSFQAVPVDGYTAMVERILDHPLIRVELGTDGLALVPYRPGRVVWTGPIDELWDYCLGRLPYRSMRFEFRSVPGRGLVQPCAAINYPSGDVPWTRETEFRHITGQQHRWTTILREFPTGDGDPYYPVPQDANRMLYRQYLHLTERELPNVVLVGRLATYKYLDMDMAVGQALATAAKCLRSV